MVKIEENRYHLKSLHDEIDLYDRKLAHVLKFETFDTDAARKTAADKLSTKRATLVETSQRLIAQGIEYKVAELPRSLRPADVPSATHVAIEPTPVVTVIADISEAPKFRGERKSSSVYAGTSLDWEKNIREYMLKKA